MSGVHDVAPQTPSSRSSDLRRSAVSVPSASISGTPLERRARRNRPVLPRLFATETPYIKHVLAFLSPSEALGCSLPKLGSRSGGGADLGLGETRTAASQRVGQDDADGSRRPWKCE